MERTIRCTNEKLADSLSFWFTAVVYAKLVGYVAVASIVKKLQYKYPVARMCMYKARSGSFQFDLCS